jgi:hypothetical protein
MNPMSFVSPKMTMASGGGANARQSAKVLTKKGFLSNIVIITLTTADNLCQLQHLYTGVNVMNAFSSSLVVQTKKLECLSQTRLFELV